ncbi:MAG: fibronectin type III domain-containing protein [Mycobacteriales bacterium]
MRAVGRSVVVLVLALVPVVVGGQVSGVPASTPITPVHGLRGVAVDGPGVTVSWHWPSTSGATTAVVRYAYGRRAPRTASSGDAAGVVRRSSHSVTVYGLVPTSRYAFAVFARGHGKTAPAATVTVRTGEVPTITSTSLPAGTVGSPYTAHLTVAHGTSGTWAVDSGQLPDGLALSGSQIAGTPTTAGDSSFVLRYTDRHGAVSYAGVSITVNSSAPPTPTPTPTPTGTPTPTVSPTATP